MVTQRHHDPIGRIPIVQIAPVVDSGRWAAKAFAGEVIPFGATVFREGHDAVGAELLLVDPKGLETVHRMQLQGQGTDRWQTQVRLDAMGSYRFVIRAFSDDFETWHHNTEVKLAAGIDQELMLLEGIELFQRAAQDMAVAKPVKEFYQRLAEKLSDKLLSPFERFLLASEPSVREKLAANPIRSLVTLSAEHIIVCERELAGRGAWYEFFPRSEGAKYSAKTKTWTSGTFKTAAKRLPDVKAMGFDVLYLPPIHPIGRTFRKGPN
ncbi:MAG: hypothetical protein RL670_1271, partial [Actinomycetota bacterium]